MNIFLGIIMNTARRQSNALSVGSTPLNKVITIILAAQKTSPAYVAQALDEVILDFVWRFMHTYLY